MNAENCTAARKVHALLFSALPHRDDSNLKEAAELALRAAESNFHQTNPTLQAIQTTIMAIENGVGSDGNLLLLKATREAEQWVRSVCSDDT